MSDGTQSKLSSERKEIAQRFQNQKPCQSLKAKL
jgi:hypothetical protein